VQGDERFTVSDLELLRQGPSYTVDTLQELSSRVPDSELVLILGGDVAAGFANWHRPEDILSLATVAVAKRRGTARASVEAAVAGLRGGDRMEFFRMPRIGLASTMIRRRAAAGQPLKYLVPDAVADHIRAHGLYGAAVPR
jgi:nicotinate-nucleotide adenylyltransferase